MTVKDYKKLVADLYLPISNGEFVFPEFAGMTKKRQKELSLKTHSVLQRYSHTLEEENGNQEDNREAS